MNFEVTCRSETALFWCYHFLILASAKIKKKKTLPQNEIDAVDVQNAHNTISIYLMIRI